MSASSFRLSSQNNVPKPLFCNADALNPLSNASYPDASASNSVLNLSDPPPALPFHGEPLFSIPEYNPGPEFYAVPPPPAATVAGTFEYDLAHNFTLRWPSLLAMQAWKTGECSDKSIEFVKKYTSSPDQANTAWTGKRIYVCARQGSGGRSKYQPKHSWTRKIASKRVGCPCRLTVKTYPGTSEVLGFYKSDHSHSIGDENVKYTRLDPEIRKEIENLLRLGVDPKKVLERITKGIYHEHNLENIRSQKANRRDFATRADVRRIQKMIEEETIRLAAQDGPSVLEWAAKLREQGHFVDLKRSDEAPPAGSALEPNSFVMIIQTKYQRECWQKHGSKFAGIDGTHNTTHYENMTLFTLLVRDKWGHGMPAGWMISSNGKEVTIDYFLATILRENPDIFPNVFMSDFDRAQLNSIRRRYPMSRLFLCWWHVLHAWQQHFVTQHHPLLWERLKSWIRITDQAEFDAHWTEIQTLAPPSIVEYLERYWLPEVHLWSAVFRRDRGIFELGDTNMLVESWHHLLKGTFLEGKRNRRLDHLIHVLCEVAIPHFIARHCRQEMGFEGPDLELKHRLGITTRAASVPISSIQYDNETKKYIVRSQTDSEIFYEVDLEAYDCTCLSFPLIHFCKHICAVQTHFPETNVNLPVSLLSAPSLPKDEDSEDEDFDSPEPDHWQTQSDADLNAVDNLAQRLQSLAILFQVDPPSPLTVATRAAVHDATTILESLAQQLMPSDSILPRKRVKIAPNQGSDWPATTAAMIHAPVKSRKRNTEHGPYSGNEQSGKKARSDAREPLPLGPDDAAASTSTQESILPSESLQSYYRHRPNAPPPATPSLPANMNPKPVLPAENKSFDAESFNLDDDNALNNLNNRQLRVLCKKYNIDPARGNVEMVSRLQRFRARCARPPPPPTFAPMYSPYYYPYLQPMYPSHRPY